MTERNLRARQRARLQTAFEAEERRGIVLSVRARLGAYAMISLWMQIEMDPPHLYYYLVMLLLFAAIALGWLFTNRGPLRAAWVKYALVTLEMGLLSWILIAPPPLPDWPWPPTIIYYGSTVTFYFVLLGATVFAYAPGLVLWAGLMAALGWSAGVAWVTAQPGVRTTLDPEAAAHLSVDEILAQLYDPYFVDLGERIEDVLTILIVTGVLAAAVWRVRRVVWRQARAERERGNLSRYFPPNMVDDLARLDSPLGPVRQQRVAVLFADIVGFTRLSENQPPEAVIQLLRAFDARMEQEVFAFGGTLDKYLGDGIMATFGTPRSGERDAVNAVACARALVRSVEAWNEERRRRGEPPIRIGVGAHIGPVVLGDVGGERRLEFAVIGDTVNVASRLEQLTRKLDTPIVISAALAEEARRQGGEAALADFIPGEASWVLRGREQAVSVWTAKAA
ncbi:MAG: adenylate/guanylate cyclase domain-containing protein [Alphaproteobacteria bacterium]|nr:adenylate/guanylate cyclase domain-containing protein [Alphaproteobacteria bacterium]